MWLHTSLILRGGGSDVLRFYIEYTYGTFHKNLDNKGRSNCVHTVTDQALTDVFTVYVPQDFDTACFFSSSHCRNWLVAFLPLHLETRFTTLRSCN